MVRDIVHSAIALRMPSMEAGPDDYFLALDLLDTLEAHANECVGVAANMVGERKRVIAFMDGAGSGAERSRAMLNPELIEASGPYESEEGCLSLLGTRTCTRYEHITVRFQDERLAWHEESFSGYTARIIQHEIDHCNGVVI